MILIIGGRYQGRHRFANTLSGTGQVIDTAFATVMERLQTDLGEALGSLPEAELLTVTEGIIKQLLPQWQQKTLILEESGSGIIPTDRDSRMAGWVNGCLNRMLAAQAEAVYRVFCGLGYRLD